MGKEGEGASHAPTLRLQHDLAAQLGDLNFQADRGS